MITLLFVFLVLAVPAFADVPVVYQEYPAVRVIVNGQEVNGGILMDGRTMVPLRAISELLGLNVQWDDLRSL
ncbi:MAG TPA: copper amine oxidase N-terminal domain-containing protein [Desulfotomaculum sp.]|nr:copper amine oxidase N-terminal domain-containing protein [Desulfotomaculum sp.]